MFWKRKPTISSDDEQWQLETWNWLFRNFGGLEALQEYSVAVPSRSHFPPSGLEGHEHAEFVFGQVVGRFGYSSDGFDLVPQEAEIDPVLSPLAVANNTPTNPLGTYSAPDGNRHVITYSPSLLADLESLIATLAHEICHPILLSVMEPPPGEPTAEEFATDLAMIFFGFGIFGANASFAFQQFTDNGTGTQGWSVKRAGYLTHAEWGFGLALRTVLSGEDEQQVLKYLSPDAAAHYARNLKYMRKNPGLLADLKT